MNKIKSFQVLRAFAVTLIFLSHCFNSMVWLGGAGVSLFIALSGFLAVMKYKDRQISSVQLYKARWKQFYKLHVITLIISIIPMAFSLSSINISWKWWIKLLFNLSLTQALIPNMAVYFSFNAVSWYLSLTIILALFTPIAIKLYYNLSCNGIIKTLIMLTIAEVLLCILLHETKHQHWVIYISPLTRFWDFAIGGGIKNF